MRGVQGRLVFSGDAMSAVWVTEMNDDNFAFLGVTITALQRLFLHVECHLLLWLRLLCGAIETRGPMLHYSVRICQNYWALQSKKTPH